MKLRIKNDMNGTYYRATTRIGPAFGATWDDAAVFTDGMEAYRLMKTFPMTVLADLVNEKDQPCTVEGKPLGGAS